MSESSRWQTFFDEHAPVYNENIFTKNTVNEVDFLIEELRPTPRQARRLSRPPEMRGDFNYYRPGEKITGED